MPKTIFVAGTRRNAGKTLVSEFLLRSLPGSGAIKLTCCRHDKACPRERPCGVCGALGAPFAVILEHAVLSQPGKDTARLLAAASGRVVWLQSREAVLAEAMAAALSRLDTEPVVVVEGNAAFQAAEPDLGVLVAGPGREPPKPSVNFVLRKVGVVVRNLRPGLPPPTVIHGLREGIAEFAFDAGNPEGDPSARAFIEWVGGRLKLGQRGARS